MDSGAGGGRGGGAGEANGSLTWTEEVDDLLDAGDIDGAISLLESVISHLEALKTPTSSTGTSVAAAASFDNDSDRRLASALDDLANLHSTCGFSIKADELRSRSRSLLLRAEDSRPHHNYNLGSRDHDAVASKEKSVKEKEQLEVHVLDEEDEKEVDDWEAIADDNPPDFGICSVKKEDLTVSSTHSDKVVDSVTLKRRGRGSFLYRKNGLYSDEVDVGKYGGDSDSQDNFGQGSTRADDIDKGERRFGTRHVLVLYDFPPSTRTVELEKPLERFGDSGFSIRWVNDTCALAVFRTPVAAHEAQNSITFPFKVRAVDEDDSLLDQISRGELEPPYPRPKTSARTAHRMITQVMGLKPSTGFGSNELKEQEQARKNRIHARRNMRDDAWGSDD